MFLQRRLEVLSGNAAAFDLAEQRMELRRMKARASIDAAVEINGGDQRFVSIGKKRRLRRPPVFPSPRPSSR